MNKVTQLLLLLSYAVFGIAAAVLLPFLGVTAATAQIVGVLVFVGAWQVQLSFFSQSGDEIDPIDMHRVEEIEKLALKLRNDVEALQEAIEEQNEKGDAKDKKLVSELKMLQEFLIQVMQKEAKGKKAPAKSAKPKTTAADDDEQMTAEEIEELGLAPEEAALVIVDDDDDDMASEEDIAKALDEAEREEERAIAEDSLEGEADDQQTDETNTDEPAPEKVQEPPKAITPPPAPAKPTPKAEPKTEPKPGSQPQRVQTHAQRRAAAAKKRAPIRLIKREDQLLSVIKNSLSENRVDLYLQPIVSLPARKTAHFECFSRVRDEEGRVVLPRQYMKVAETRGLIGTIDNLLLFRLIQLVRKLGRRRPDVRFFLNMSRYSIADKEFLPQFIDFMASNVEFAERMVFEISQEDYLTLEDEAVDRLNTLGRKGFAFSMDMVNDFDQDFAELEKRNFKYIKADLTDILDMHPEPGEIEEQKSYLRRRGMQLIASKIEGEEMVIEALDNQIELAQGYLFGEPLSAEEIDTDL